MTNSVTAMEKAVRVQYIFITLTVALPVALEMSHCNKSEERSLD